MRFPCRNRVTYRIGNFNTFCGWTAATGPFGIHFVGSIFNSYMALMQHAMLWQEIGVS
ncbi:MAG TPA: hypothetical protein VMS17_09860 [Gemmataceae bacterium]|nr:hypothetical protein [Gemmataceae bacterium]